MSKKIKTKRGYIRERKTGVYNVAVSLGKDPKTGKYRYQWATVRGTTDDAKTKLTELQHQLNTGILIRPGKVHLREYLDRWLKDYVWPNLSPRTAEGYEHICNHHLSPSLGSVTLNGLKPEHLQHYYSEKLSGGCLSAQTVRHHHTCLHKALQTAVEWGLVARKSRRCGQPAPCSG